MKRNRLLVAQHALVLEMFENGLAQTRIADSLNVPVGAVKKVISNKYPDFSGRRFLPTKEVVSKYNDGATLDAIAVEYNTTSNTVRSHLEKAGVQIIPGGEQRRLHHFSEDFFECIDSPQKAYWLGFIFADGVVMSTRQDIAIALHSRDHGHLENFMADLSYQGPGAVKRYVGDFFGGKVEYSKVSLRSTKMWFDVISHGCLPNKSKDTGAPLDLPKTFVDDFIRGVVDGGGYISGQGYPSVGIVGSYDLLVWIASELGLGEPKPHKTMWRIRANGTQAKAVVRRLYATGGRSLERKQERADRMMGGTSE